MAEAIINEPLARRHSNAGRKQSAEHIAKRVAAVAATKAKWLEENKFAVSQRMAVAHLRTSNLETIIYGLFDPLSKQLRYVGKTTATLERRWSIHGSLAKRKTPRHIYNWWRGLLACGVEPEIFEIDRIPPGGDWVEAEQFWIAYFRFVGCNLVNRCDGGQGTTGIIFSDQHIDRLRASHIGNRRSPEHQRKMKEIHLAAWRRNPGSRWKPGQLEKTLATKAERRAAGLYKKRAPATEETKAKISAGKRGKPLTDAHKAKLSAIRKGKQIGRVIPEESRKKMSAAHMGVPLSEAHRAAQSRAHQIRLGKIQEA
jgi:hypothetical protein